MPKVSIIIPVYKVEKYLPDCLNSVLSQTFQDWEAICVNDGSPDNCDKILAKYTKKDKRIKVITQENQGVSVARNNGLKQAKGEYICFLDGDDALAPTFLEKMYTQIDSAKADIISCDFQKTPCTNKNKQKNSQKQIYNNVFDCFLRGKPKIISSIWAKLFKKTILKGLSFPKGVAIGEDLVFLYQTLFQAKKAVYLPEKLYFYRTREESATKTTFSEKIIIGNIQTAMLWHEYFKNKKLSTKTRKLLNKKIARQIFRPAVLDPKRKDAKHLDKWYTLSKPLLQELKQEGIYQPKYLSIKNRFISFFFLKGGKNA